MQAEVIQVQWYNRRMTITYDDGTTSTAIAAKTVALQKRSSSSVEPESACSGGAPSSSSGITCS